MTAVSKEQALPALTHVWKAILLQHLDALRKSEPQALENRLLKWELLAHHCQLPGCRKNASGRRAGRQRVVSGKVQLSNHAQVQVSPPMSGGKIGTEHMPAYAKDNREQKRKRENSLTQVVGPSWCAPHHYRAILIIIQ
jgi:hypothetical protein